MTGILIYKTSFRCKKKTYVDNRLAIKSENTLLFNGFRLSDTGSPIDKNNVVNLGHMKDNTLTLDKEGFNAVNRQY